MKKNEHADERRVSTEDPIETGSGDMSALIATLRSDLHGIYGNVKRALYVEWQRLQLRAVDVFFRAAFYVCLLAFALTASVSAALLVVQGIKHALLAMTGAEWVGDLGAGLAVLAFVIVGGVAVRLHLRREIVRKTKRSLARRDADRAIAQQRRAAAQAGDA